MITGRPAGTNRRCCGSDANVTFPVTRVPTADRSFGGACGSKLDRPSRCQAGLSVPTPAGLHRDFLLLIFNLGRSRLNAGVCMLWRPVRPVRSRSKPEVLSCTTGLPLRVGLLPGRGFTKLSSAGHLQAVTVPEPRSNEDADCICCHGRIVQ